MTSKDFDQTAYMQKFLLLQDFGKEVDTIVLPFEPSKIVSIHAIHNFFVALHFDKLHGKMLSVKAFDDIHYLNKHTDYTAKLDLSSLLGMDWFKYPDELASHPVHQLWGKNGIGNVEEACAPFAYAELATLQL